MNNKLTESKNDKLNIFISFLIPMLILGCAYALFGISPFGKKSILVGDMNNQYIDFHASLYNIVKNRHSLFYNWSAGLGLNFIGIYAYYLASPFTFIILLFKKQLLPEALVLITLLKVGASGLTFSLYARYVYNKSNMYISIFSISYALMSYSIVYSSNIMWLDGVVFLPLVILGVEKIIRENKPITLCISLFMIFIANFYISYMVGLFSFIYLIVRYLSVYPLREIRYFYKKFVMFTMAALLAAGCAAFLLLPAYFALKNGQGDMKLNIFSLKPRFHWTALLSKFPMGSYDSIKNGLPNIYSGIFALLLALIYFFNNRISLKERVLNFLLILFFMLSFNIPMLNIAWHAFDVPNWFPYRYSFIFSFLIISIAFRSFTVIGNARLVNILIPYAVGLLGFTLLLREQYTYLPNQIVYANIAFISLYSILLCMFIFNQRMIRKSVGAFIFILVVFEMSCSTYYLISRVDNELNYQPRNSYSESLNRLNDLVPTIREKDKGFYRIERTHRRTFNDSINLGYNSISHYSSMSNGALLQFFKRLGMYITASDKASNYYGSTLITDSIFGIKYRLDVKPPGIGYKEVYNKNGMAAYENTYALPLGFLVNGDIMNLNIKQDNPFNLQNDLLNLSLGNRNIHTNYLMPISEKKIILNNVVVYNNGNGEQKFVKRDKDKEGFVEFIINNPKSQKLYMYLKQRGYSLVDVYVNDKLLGIYMNVYNKDVFDLGYCRKDNNLRVKLVLKDRSFIISGNYFCGLDNEKLKEGIDVLKTQGFEKLQVNDTSVSGYIKAKENALLFTSIPYDPGWSALVDGNVVPVKKIADSLIGIELSKGYHNIEFRFVPQGLKYGLVISAISFILFIIILIQNKRIKHH